MKAMKIKYPKTYFSWIVTIVTVIVIVFSLFIITILGTISAKNIRRQMDNDFNVLSYGLEKDMESIDNSLKNFCEYIYINDTIVGNIFAENAELTKVYSDLRTVYSSAKTINSNIVSMQFYNKHAGVLYSIGSNLDTNENQLDDILKSADSITANTMLLRKMKYFVNLQPREKMVLSYFVYETGSITKDSSFLAINLDCDWLMESLKKYSVVHENDGFVIFSPDNEFILLSSQDLDEYKDKIIETVSSKNKYIDIKNERCALYSTVIESNNLTICSLFPISDAYDSMDRFKSMLLVFGLLILILGIILSFYVSRKIYMPFNKLYSEIAKSDIGINELENIKMLFHRYNETLINYEKQLTDESEQIKSYAIHKLLDSSEELSELDIEKYFGYLSIDMRQCFVVAILCVDMIKSGVIGDDALVNYALYNISMEVIGRKYKAEGVQTSGNGVAVIINVNEGSDTDEKLCKIICEIKNHMEKIFGAVISSSISSPVQLVEEISTATFNARSNLIYRFNYGYGQVFTETTVASNQQNTAIFVSQKYENMLVNSVEEESAVAALDKIIGEIQSMNYQNAVMESLRLVRILHEKMQIDVDMPISGYSNNLEINNTLPTFYDEVCKKLSDKFASVERRTERDAETMWMVGEAKAYIEKNFLNNEANIVELAQLLKVSQRRLSVDFKNETGMSFAAYLTQFRINKAKEYILKNEFDMKDISSMVGISNPTYFYKLFKNECGITPTQYKKIHGSAK